jgi:nitrate reductase gamma subunit
MDAWIEIARGPLFRLCLLICALGLAYRLGNALFQVVGSWRRAGDGDIPLATVARATLRWLLPIRLLRARPLYSVASIAFHAGILLLPLFLAGHVVLWQASVPIPWPTLAPSAADILTAITVAALAALLLGRLLARAARALTRAHDVLIVLLLFLLTAGGFLAAHPAFSPFDARAVLLVHVLLGDLTLALTPATKLVHCALVPFTQLLSELGWHFPAESGRHVAAVLGKENEPV